MRWTSLNPLEAYAMRMLALEKRKGETRIIRKFLLKPTYLRNDEHTRWLEYAYIHQQLKEDSLGTVVWTNIGFATEAEFILNFPLPKT